MNFHISRTLVYDVHSQKSDDHHEKVLFQIHSSRNVKFQRRCIWNPFKFSHYLKNYEINDLG